MNIAERVRQIGIIPVVSLPKLEHALPLAESLMEGGLPCAEITFRTAAAADSIEQIAKRFPELFLGAGTVLTIEQAQRALDCGARTINDEMEIAAVHAIAELAQAEQSEVVAAAYVGEQLAFGPEYLIPKPFDPRLMMKIAPAVAQAAAASGVATRPVKDLDAYREKLQSFVYASGTIMKPIFTAVKSAAGSCSLTIDTPASAPIICTTPGLGSHTPRP